MPALSNCSLKSNIAGRGSFESAVTAGISLQNRGAQRCRSSLSKKSQPSTPDMVMLGLAPALSRAVVRDC